MESIRLCVLFHLRQLCELVLTLPPSQLNNCGSVVVNVASGAIQDQATPGKNEYNGVFAFLIVIKGLDVLYGGSPVRPSQTRGGSR